MVNGINFNSINYTLPFKSAEKNSVISKPVELQNKNLNGLEALGNYNSTLAMQTPDFDIPILEPVEIPRDINNIKGKRIYSSDGKLVQIVDEDADFKKVYLPMEHGISYSIIDKKINKEVVSQMHWYDNNEIMIERYNPQNGYSYATTYENNELINYYKEKKFNNGSSITVNYDNREQLYNYEVYDAKTSSIIMKRYNAEKQLIDKCVKKYGETSNSRYQTNYIGTEPISEEYTQINSMNNNIANKILSDKDLKPSPKIEYPTNLNKIQGKKTYYSDGTVESVITPDNIKYTYDLGKNLVIINDENIEVHYNPDDNRYTIEEKFNDNESKTTVYHPNGDIFISYHKNDNDKEIWLSNGKISHYNEYIDGRKKFIMFDEEGNAIKEFDNFQDYYNA